MTASTEQSMNAHTALVEGRGGNKGEYRRTEMDMLLEARHSPEDVPQEDPEDVAFTKAIRNMLERGQEHCREDQWASAEMADSR